MNKIKNFLDLDYDPTADPKFIDWANSDNKETYMNIPIDQFKQFTVTSKINKNEDVHLIYESYIKPANAIFELGAGYGRVIQALLDLGFQGTISAVERDEKFYSLLLKKYQNQIKLYKADISDMILEQRFDLILWLWSGFAEFSKSEQPRILSKVTDYLVSGGMIIIDTILIPSSESKNKHQHHWLKTEYGLHRRYFATEDEFKRYSNKASIKLIKILPYAKTKSGKEKALYICKKL